MFFATSLMLDNILENAPNTINCKKCSLYNPVDVECTNNSINLNIKDLGWTKEQAQDIRGRFNSFIEDWDNDEDYDWDVTLKDSDKSDNIRLKTVECREDYDDNNR
jgi:hypothetical protein